MNEVREREEYEVGKEVTGILGAFGLLPTATWLASAMQTPVGQAC